MAKPIGQLNFILEDMVEYLITELNYSWKDILFLVLNELQKYPLEQEEYCEGGNPKFSLSHKGKKLRETKRKPLNKKQEIIFQRLIKNYVLQHEMQWGEVLHIIHGYLSIHRPDAKDCDFYYGF